MWRHQKIAVGQLPGVAGQRVEQVGQVGTDVRRRRQQTDILVQPCRLAVVVAGADMAVPPDDGALSAYHQAGLAVCLEADEAVDHMHARLLQGSRPPDVGLLIEARLDLYHCHHLLSGLGGGDQRPTIGESPEVRYSVCLIARTFGSEAASSMKRCTLVENESYGW